jgi:hypothetical protein
MSESWLVELTDTTTVFNAGAEFDWDAVLVPLVDPSEHPAHTHTATIATSTFGIRTIRESISSVECVRSPAPVHHGGVWWRSRDLDEPVKGQPEH